MFLLSFWDMDGPTATTQEPILAPKVAPAEIRSPGAPVSRDGLRTSRVSGWRSIDILRAAALVIGLYLLLRLIWVGQAILFAAFLGILFGLAVAKGTDWLEKLRIPRGIGAALLVFGFYGLLAGMLSLAAPTLQKQFGELRTRIPEATDRVETWLEKHRGGMMGQLLVGGAETATTPAERPTPPTTSPDAARRGAAPARETAPGAATGGGAPAGAASPQAGQGEQAPGPGGGLPTTLRGTLSSQLGNVSRYMFRFLSSTLAVITGLILITFIAIYIGASPGVYQKGLLHLFPHQARPRAHEVLTAVGTTLRRWLVSQLIAMVVIGAVTTVALMILGVEAALSLGLIAGLLEFIPNIGPLLSALPAVAMGFVDSPQKALMVAAVYGGIQFAENHLLIPILMRKGVDLPPVLTLIGQALMALVFGFLGLLVAVPLIATAVVVIKMLYVEDVVGDDVQVPGEAGSA